MPVARRSSEVRGAREILRRLSGVLAVVLMLYLSADSQAQAKDGSDQLQLLPQRGALVEKIGFPNFQTQLVSHPDTPVDQSVSPVTGPESKVDGYGGYEYSGDAGYIYLRNYIPDGAPPGTTESSLVFIKPNTMVPIPNTNLFMYYAKGNGNGWVGVGTLDVIPGGLSQVSPGVYGWDWYSEDRVTSDLARDGYVLNPLGQAVLRHQLFMGVVDLGQSPPFETTPDAVPPVFSTTPPETESIENAPGYTQSGQLNQGADSKGNNDSFVSPMEKVEISKRASVTSSSIRTIMLGGVLGTVGGLVGLGSLAGIALIARRAIRRRRRGSYRFLY